MVTLSDQVMLTFLITSAVAVAMMWLARQLLQPKWEHLAHRFPSHLLHRWSLGSFGLLALYVFFVLPFALLGQYVVALTAFLITTFIILFFARDVLDWIISDIREHRAQKRKWFQHSDDCVVTVHYHGSGEHPH
jgi:hypothetical protein